eukprot:GGOE01036463.1.p1 GENE.GGOE01036463.1~~GGOE01036463.1.p1  ORF type:complete len:616 (-),score=176.94 GGOE01036463.1:177-2024(-)
MSLSVFRRALRPLVPGLRSSAALPSCNHLPWTARQPFHSSLPRWDEPEKSLPFGGRNPKSIVDECDAILKLQPNEPTVLINKAIALHSMGHWLEALAVATFAQEVAPEDARVTLHLLRAECLYQTGKAQEALEEVDNAITLGTTNAGIHGLRAQCLYALSKDEEALQEAEVACQEQPKNGQLHFLRGCLLHAAGTLQDALGALNRASRYAPEDSGIHLERARVLRELGDREAAKSALQKSLAINSSSPFALNMMGILLSEEGNLEEALKSWDAALSLNPTDAAFIGNKGKCLHRLHRYQEAVELFRKSLEAGGGTGDGLHAAMGECLTFLGSFQEALPALQEAIRQQPEDGMSHALAAFAHRALGDMEAALTAVERACELDPDRSNWHAMRGQMLEAVAKSDEAIAAFERSLQLDCKSESAADTYYCRGMIRGKRGDVDGAVHDFDSALQLNGNHELAIAKKAQWLEEQGKNEDALVLWEKLVAVIPDDVKALTYRGKCLARLSRNEEAQRDLEKAIERSNGSCEPHKALGAMRWQAGQKEEAYSLWRKGSLVDPTDLYCHYLQAVYQAESGNPKAALEALDKAVKCSAEPPPEVLELQRDIIAVLQQMEGGAQS